VSVDPAELREKIEFALAEVDAAETALATLLLELRRAPRAEKVTVTDVVENAFARLRTARQELARLHDLVAVER
jgi:hypothetical protein